MFPVSNVYDVMSFIKYADENESANGVERQNGNRNYKYVYIYMCVCVDCDYQVAESAHNVQKIEHLAHTSIVRVKKVVNSVNDKRTTSFSRFH